MASFLGSFEGRTSCLHKVSLTFQYGSNLVVLAYNYVFLPPFSTTLHQTYTEQETGCNLDGK